MNLCNEIKSFFGDLKEQSCFYVFGNNGGYFEGVKSIVSFDELKIELLVKKTIITLIGEGLSIAKYSGGDVAVLGKISSVVIK